MHTAVNRHQSDLTMKNFLFNNQDKNQKILLLTKKQRLSGGTGWKAGKLTFTMARFVL